MIMTIVADGGGGGIIIAMFAGMTMTVVVIGGGDTAESSEGNATASRTMTLTGGRFCGQLALASGTSIARMHTVPSISTYPLSYFLLAILSKLFR